MTYYYCSSRSLNRYILNLLEGIVLGEIQKPVFEGSYVRLTLSRIQARYKFFHDASIGFEYVLELCL